MAWIIWLTAGLFYTYEFVHRIAPGIMVPELMAEFNVSGKSLGNLSAYYYYAYAIAQIPIGILLDRYSTRYLLVFAATLIAVGSFVFSNTGNIEVANSCRVIIGLGSAFSFVGCLKLATNWFSHHKFGLVVGLTNFLGATGAILGGRPLAHYIEQHGWRNSMELSGIIGVIFIVAIWVIVRDKKLMHSKESSKTSQVNSDNLKQKLTAIIKNQQIWLIAIFGSLMVVPIASYTELWGVSFLTETYGFSKPIAGQIVTFTFIGIAFGGPINGWISDLIGKRTPIMLVGAIGSTVTIASIIYLNDISFIHLTILHIIFGFFTSSMLLCFSLNAEISNMSARGTVIGFTNTLIMGISAIFQPLIGSILDRFAINNFNFVSNIYSLNAFQIAFLPLILCLISAVLILIRIKEVRY